MARKHRLNLIIPDRAMQRLDWLKDRTDAASQTEVIRQALFAYEQLVCSVLEGSKLMEKTAKGELRSLAISIDVKTPVFGSKLTLPRPVVCPHYSQPSRGDMRAINIT